MVYADKHGTTAAHGAGRRHSPFTEVLLKHIATPDLEIRFQFGNVGDDVMALTGRAQEPHVYSNLGWLEDLPAPIDGFCQPAAFLRRE